VVQRSHEVKFDILLASNGGSKVYVGVLAQEVQQVTPQAVARGTDGYLRVFYEKLGLKFETYDHWIKSGALPINARMQR